MTIKTKSEKINNRIFAFSCPKSTEAIRETYVARYPNGKVDTTPSS